VRRAFGEGLPAPARNRLNAAAPRLNHKPSLHKAGLRPISGASTNPPDPRVLGLGWSMDSRVQRLRSRAATKGALRPPLVGAAGAPRCRCRVFSAQHPPTVWFQCVR
jgi:hypothetical protein